MTRRAARRWLTRAALCLVLGLVTTVAVAWALAAWLPHEGVWTDRGTVWLGDNADVMAIETWEAGRRGMRRRSWHAIVSGGSPLVLALTHPEGRPAPPSHVLKTGPLWAEPLDCDPWGPDARLEGTEDARGWPMLSLWCEYRPVLVTGAWRWQVFHGVLLTSPPPFEPLGVRVLPLQPIWFGLLANTGVYALGWGVVLFAPGWARRARRRAKGWCTGCGYDRAGLAEETACPECGFG